MTALFRHPFRVIGRLIWITVVFILAALVWVRRCAFAPETSALAARALWLQHTTRRLLRIFRTQPQVSGAVPSRGLLVSNHLSYFDILVLASISPAVFVAKHEVKSWPVFGWFARLAGTVFVDRERRTHVGQVADEIQSALDRGVLVILFPEGTSSGGETVLPFKSALLEPATRRAHCLSVSLIQYAIDDGNVSEEICYWKDMTLVPHVLNLLSKRTVRASVRFNQVTDRSTDRKELARQLHGEVLRLKNAPDAVLTR
jgi:1-acyl-sn-glycerol-3-phosphate acyltransferase